VTFTVPLLVFRASPSAFAATSGENLSLRHASADDRQNLVYACMVCNRYKDSNIASVGLSGELVPLFNPRQDQWRDHYRLNGPVVEPLGLIGDLTTQVLRLNAAERLVRRSLVQQLRQYPRSRFPKGYEGYSSS
jgi:hypothetical protein